MEVINFADTSSLISRYMLELRDVDIQKDPVRFRLNIRRIGQIMAYEISRRLEYRDVDVQTPLGVCRCRDIADHVVLATILRAGLPFHEGFLDNFDRAENAFVSAYRKYRDNSDDFDVVVEYMASPSVEDKTVLLIDPMLATGHSMYLGYKALCHKGNPRHVHVASVIASRQGIDFVRSHFPAEKTTVWCGAIDDRLDDHSYIVPGLGDAGDLAYGPKEE